MTWTSTLIEEKKSTSTVDHNRAMYKYVENLNIFHLYLIERRTKEEKVCNIICFLNDSFSLL
jgi:hypothetical protein